MFCNSDGLKHGLLPETPAALYCGESIDDAQGQDAFDRTRDNPENEGFGVVLIPCLDVKSQRSYIWVM